MLPAVLDPEDRGIPEVRTESGAGASAAGAAQGVHQPILGAAGSRQK